MIDKFITKWDDVERIRTVLNTLKYIFEESTYTLNSWYETSKLQNYHLLCAVHSRYDDLSEYDSLSQPPVPVDIDELEAKYNSLIDARETAKKEYNEYEKYIKDNLTDFEFLFYGFMSYYEQQEIMKEYGIFLYTRRLETGVQEDDELQYTTIVKLLNSFDYTDEFSYIDEIKDIVYDKMCCTKLFFIVEDSEYAMFVGKTEYVILKNQVTIFESTCAKEALEMLNMIR